mmetsp:Transcript_2084/g.6098  ORF Transcript_2084/g.6098 Transcript_2084/m.6098 type:complete len:286 (+) Transcript_2084:1610-2467(+)
MEHNIPSGGVRSNVWRRLQPRASLRGPGSSAGAEKPRDQPEERPVATDAVRLRPITQVLQRQRWRRQRLQGRQYRLRIPQRVQKPSQQNAENGTHGHEEVGKPARVVRAGTSLAGRTHILADTWSPPLVAIHASGRGPPPRRPPPARRHEPRGVGRRGRGQESGGREAAAAAGAAAAADAGGVLVECRTAVVPLHLSHPLQKQVDLHLGQAYLKQVLIPQRGQLLQGGSAQFAETWLEVQQPQLREQPVPLLLPGHARRPGAENLAAALPRSHCPQRQRQLQWEG